VKTDAVLLADVFENFRKACMKKYGLDPAHYYTAPGLSWDARLKKTGVELELLTDLNMHLKKAGRNLDGEQAVRGAQQPAGRRP